MASVFTYEPDPPRIASPWSTSFPPPPLSSSAPGGTAQSESMIGTGDVNELGGLLVPNLARLEDYGLPALEAEPELGPVEYKTHLLLRSRGAFVSSSSTGVITTEAHGQAVPPRHYHQRHQPQRTPTGDSAAALLKISTASSSNGHAGVSLSAGTASPHSRQQRLLHLTTQLLWRLKQSAPNHAFSAVDSIVPRLPEALGNCLDAPARPERLLPGLEESQGAMYEIGVADDGSFVGLTRDEMEESLVNLRAMAASLGCKVKILRAVVIGVCQPARESAVAADESRSQKKAPTGIGQKVTIPRAEKLYVVEALVLPDTRTHTNGQAQQSSSSDDHTFQSPRGDNAAEKSVQDTEQLRISLTGSTTSGKSTLLGTLLTSTFDDARGKSRLNLLKHRHEIASGVTSSVAHELLGYQQSDDYVVNYAYENVDSWTDVHDRAEGGRLVLLTDSAGHPRFRRTIVRSLVAWQPHWTLCCIAAAYDSKAPLLDGQPTDENILSPSQLLAIAHLELCLKLGLPLVVVITKYDLATKGGLRQILSSILTILKAAGRIPHLLKPSASVKAEDDLQTIPHHDMHEIRTIIEQMQDDYNLLVPIVLTSSVNGIGITKLHAFLRQLPIPQVHEFGNVEAVTSKSFDWSAASLQASTSTLFNIDEVFVKNAHLFGPSDSAAMDADNPQTFVLSGLLSRGQIGIGDKLLLGPFSVDAMWATMERRPPLDMRRTASYPVTHHELALRRHAKVAVRRRRSSEDLADERPSRSTYDGSEGINGIDEERERPSEWVQVTVTSVRNLRLPVRTASAGQAATIGVSLPIEFSDMRPRKGMVLVSVHEDDRDTPTAETVSSCGAFQAIFSARDYHVMEPGAQFNVYTGSVRGLAKVVTVGLLDIHEDDLCGSSDDLFSLDGLQISKDIAKRSRVAPSQSPGNMTVDDDFHNGKRLEVMFQFINSREYIEEGTKIFVMPGHAGDGAAALNGYVGTTSRVMK